MEIIPRINYIASNLVSYFKNSSPERRSMAKVQEDFENLQYKDNTQNNQIAETYFEDSGGLFDQDAMNEDSDSSDHTLTGFSNYSVNNFNNESDHSQLVEIQSSIKYPYNRVVKSYYFINDPLSKSLKSKKKQEKNIIKDNNEGIQQTMLNLLKTTIPYKSDIGSEKQNNEELIRQLLKEKITQIMEEANHINSFNNYKSDMKGESLKIVIISNETTKQQNNNKINRNMINYLSYGDETIFRLINFEENMTATNLQSLQTKNFEIITCYKPITEHAKIEQFNNHQTFINNKEIRNQLDQNTEQLLEPCLSKKPKCYDIVNENGDGVIKAKTSNKRIEHSKDAMNELYELKFQSKNNQESNQAEIHPQSPEILLPETINVEVKSSYTQDVKHSNDFDKQLKPTEDLLKSYEAVQEVNTGVTECDLDHKQRVDEFFRFLQNLKSLNRTALDNEIQDNNNETQTLEGSTNHNIIVESFESLNSIRIDTKTQDSIDDETSERTEIRKPLLENLKSLITSRTNKKIKDNSNELQTLLENLKSLYEIQTSEEKEIRKLIKHKENKCVYVRRGPITVLPRSPKNINLRDGKNKITKLSVTPSYGESTENGEDEEQVEELLPPPMPMDWKTYHRIDTIYNFLDELEYNNPSLCSVLVIGQSHEGRNIKVLKVSNSNETNSSVWIDAGIHAREWIGPAVNTYVANYIVKNFRSLPEYVTNKDWYFLPVANPDGYEYSHTNNRMWRKNRGRIDGYCFGVDLNRNFGYGWGCGGSSSTPTHNFYRGPKPFSEPESQAIKNAILNSGITFKVYLSLHSYGQKIIFPFAYREELCPNYIRLLRGAVIMSKAIFETNGKIYKAGTSRDMMYRASGTSQDWCHGVAQVPYCYLIELCDKKHKFTMPQENIEEIGNEILQCFISLMEFVDKHPLEEDVSKNFRDKGITKSKHSSGRCATTVM